MVAPIVPPSPSSADDVSHHSTGDVVKRKLPLPSSGAKSELPVSTLRLSNRCVLLTYFDGDVTSCIDEHFSRALRHQSTSVMGDRARRGHQGNAAVTEHRQYNAPDLTDRTNCSMSQRHLAARSVDAQRTAYRPPTTSAVDWSAMMTSSFGATTAPSVGGDCYCAEGYGPVTAALDCSSGWTQSLRFRPYYVWPDPTTTSSHSGPAHRHNEIMPPSFAATSPAPPYVDYHSLFASSRHYSHAATASSGSAYRERNDIGGVMTSSITGDAVGGDFGWSSLPSSSSSSFAIATPMTGALNRHDVTSMTSSIATRTRHCIGPTADDEFPGQGSQLLVAGEAGENVTSQAKPVGKDVYWF